MLSNARTASPQSWPRPRGPLLLTFRPWPVRMYLARIQRGADMYALIVHSVTAVVIGLFMAAALLAALEDLDRG
jgi:succinate dehydrogenase/fumarate reductase cytochrome b subunit